MELGAFWKERVMMRAVLLSIRSRSLNEDLRRSLVRMVGA